MLIDAHAHIFPAVNGSNGHGSIRSDKWGFIRNGYGTLTRLLPPAFRETSFPAESLLEYMNWTGVDHAVLMQGPLYGDLNECVLDAVEKWPDRFTGSAMIDPYISKAMRVFDWLLEMKFRILKLECSQEFGLSGLHTELDYLDDRFAQVWKRANREGMTVVLDAGSFEDASCNVDSLEAVAKTYEGVKLVLTHLLFPPGKDATEERMEQWHKSLRLGRLPNVWFDISSLVGMPGDEYPFPAARGYIRTAFEEVGPERLIFGTDMPGILKKCTYEQAIRYIDRNCVFLGDTDLDLIMWKNAMNVYAIRTDGNGLNSSEAQ